VTAFQPRIAPAVLTAAVRRFVEAEGGFATVLARGNAEAGAILLIAEEFSRETMVLERLLQPNGRYRWSESLSAAAADASSLEKFLEKRRRYDPDLWILELRVPSTERLTALLRELD
jgi:hypothetical protein